MEPLPHEKDLAYLGLEQGPLPVLITDLVGRIIYINRKFTELTGYTFEELKGKTPRILSAGKTHPDVYKNLWTTIIGGHTWKGDLLNRRKNGEEYWESLAISPVCDEKTSTIYYVGVWTESTLKKAKEKIAELRMLHLKKEARTDALTGQYNRKRILEELDMEVERAIRYQRNLSAMMIDIDDFKCINDVYGHVTGDRVIRSFGKLLRESIRRIDILGRYGGDEFLIVLPEANTVQARLVAERIQKNVLEYHHNVIGEIADFSVSIGLMDIHDAEERDKTYFVEKVDRLLLQAKRAGKNQIASPSNK